MKKHDPIKLSPTERVDLGSITKHPGLSVLVDKIIAGHAQQQLEMIHTVEPDDPERVTKLDAISATAYAMKLTHELVKREIELNWKNLLEEEERRVREAAENETEKTQ